jgi:hypothetical protein
MEYPSHAVSFSTARRWLANSQTGVAAAWMFLVGFTALGDDSDRDGIDLALTASSKPAV